MDIYRGYHTADVHDQRRGSGELGWEEAGIGGRAAWRLDANTVIDADATNNGDGGTIAVWSTGNTSSSATLTARGGLLGGNGGFIETSGEFLQVTRAVDASAPHGSAGLNPFAAVWACARAARIVVLLEARAEPGRDCPRCPRLVAFRQTWREKEPSWFNAPVPSFGPVANRAESKM